MTPSGCFLWGVNKSMAKNRVRRKSPDETPLEHMFFGILSRFLELDFWPIFCAGGTIPHKFLGGVMNTTNIQLWKKLARHNGMRLRENNLTCTKSNIIKLCNDLGITVDQFNDWSGIDRLVREYRSLNQFQERNPNMKLFELHGQLLEMLYEKEINEGMFDES